MDVMVKEDHSPDIGLFHIGTTPDGKVAVGFSSDITILLSPEEAMEWSNVLRRKAAHAQQTEARLKEGK